MMEVLSQIHAETGTDERKVEVAAIVRIDCIHKAQGPEQVSLGHITSDELNQSVPVAVH